MSESRHRERPALDESDAARASGPARRVPDGEDDSARPSAPTEPGAPRNAADPVEEVGPVSEEAPPASRDDGEEGDSGEEEDDDESSAEDDADVERDDDEPPPSEAVPDSSPMVSGDAVWGAAARSVALCALLGFAVATFLKLLLAGSWVVEFLAENALPPSRRTSLIRASVTGAVAGASFGAYWVWAQIKSRRSMAE